MKSPKTNKAWIARRDEAVEVGAAWVKDWLKKYKEPTREGKRRGEPIGFSKKKKMCAFMMILYGSVGLREIGKLCHVSEGMIRLWRSQDPAFNRTAEQACRDFSEHITNTIAHDFAGDTSKTTRLEVIGIGPHPWRRLIDLLPFYNPLVALTVSEELPKRIHVDPEHHMFLGPLLVESMAFYRDPKDKTWARNPDLLLMIKVQINALIASLTRPELRKELSDEKAAEIGKILDSIVNKYLNLLSE